MNIIQVALSFLLLTKIKCAKILAVFPTPSISHQVVFRPLTQELARRGHEVVVITTDPAFPKGLSPENLTEIDVHNISYDLWRKNFVHNLEFGKEDAIFQQVEVIVEIFPKIIEEQARHEEIRDLIHNTEWDLLFLEACSRQDLMYSHLIKAPVIQISSFGMMIGNDHIVGAPNHPILYPTGLHQRLYNLTFWEKVHELYTHWWIGRIFDDYEKVDNEMFRRVLGNDAPPLSDLRNNVDFLMLNTHPLWTDNQPWPPNVISIWGIYRQPSKELPQDLQNYLDSSKHGVIYFSLGTNALSSTLPQKKIKMLINAFEKLPYDVLWKWEKDEMPGKSNNIRILKWLPQSDVLKHPKIKLFITQGGLQSTDEAINAEVPLIGIPMLGDQWYNVEKYVHHKIGLRLDMPSLTEDKLRTAIEAVIHDPSFKQNISKLRILMNDQPQSALERAVWWTEYVLRHGGAKHLRARGANMPWTQYYEIYFIVTILALVMIALALLTLSVLFIWRVLQARDKVKTS